MLVERLLLRLRHIPGLGTNGTFVTILAINAYDSASPRILVANTVSARVKA
jgi:hypothetical protein